MDATSTGVCRANVYSNQRVSTEPGYQGRIAARDKRSAYIKKWIIPADIELLIPAFETSGRWSDDAHYLIEQFITNRFPNKADVPADKIGYATAMDYARKCISVASRISVADAIKALTECAYGGVFVPADLPAPAI